MKVELAAENKLQSDLNNKGIKENLIMKIIGLLLTTREKVYSDLRIDQINEYKKHIFIIIIIIIMSYFHSI